MMLLYCLRCTRVPAEVHVGEEQAAGLYTTLVPTRIEFHIPVGTVEREVCMRFAVVRGAYSILVGIVRCVCVRGGSSIFAHTNDIEPHHNGLLEHGK